MLEVTLFILGLALGISGTLYLPKLWQIVKTWLLNKLS